MYLKPKGFDRVGNHPMLFSRFLCFMVPAAANNGKIFRLAGCSRIDGDVFRSRLYPAQLLWISLVARQILVYSALEHVR